MLNPFPFINMAAIGGFLFYWLKLRGRLILHHPFDPNVYLAQIQNEKVEYTIAPPAVSNADCYKLKIKLRLTLIYPLCVSLDQVALP